MCEHISLWLTDLLVRSSLVSDQPGSESQNSVTDQPEPFIQLNNVQRDIVMPCDNPRAMNTRIERVDVKRQPWER
jgi:hypothetical protein